VATYPGFYGFRIAGSTTAMLVTVAANVNSGNNNFLDRGLQAPAISGSVVQDLNGNGGVNVPPDRGLPGVQVLLQNTSGQTLQSFTTDINGAWAFRNLQPGTYRVVQVVPASFAAIAAFPGPGGVALSPTTLQVTVTFGESGNNNFLDRLTQVSPTVGIISGSVLRDSNGNGRVDVPPDLPLPGVPIQLFTQSGIFIAQSTTDLHGAWAFLNVPPGFYRVAEVVPAGYVPVNAFPGPGGGFAESTTALRITAVAGVNVGSNNFLLQVSGPPPVSNTISGYAIRDRNLNGVPDGEPGLAGMTVTLRDAFNNAIASVVTGVTGSFSFSSLGSGTYTLTVVPPPGLFSTNAVPGQGGIRLSAAAIRLTTSSGTTSYPGQLFLAGP
jgi:serine-aspartate repeat-containing protein C/D/E